MRRPRSVLPAPAALALALTLPPVAVAATPGGGGCPGARDLEQALARIGAPPPPAAPPAGEGAALPAWTLVVEDGAPVVLRDPAGAVALVREVPRDGDPSCEAVAQVIALAVERYFRDVAWTAGTPAPGLAATVIDVRSSPPPPRPAVSAGASGARRLPPRLELSVGPLVWSRDPSPRAAVEVRGRIGSLVSWALAGVVPPQRQTEALAGGGELRLTAWPALARLAVEVGDARVAWRAGADGLVTLERAEAPASLADAASKRRVVLAAGVAAGLAVALAPRFRLVIEAGAYRAVLGRSFVVREAGVGGAGAGEARVLEPPAWQGLVAARVAWVLAP